MNLASILYDTGERFADRAVLRYQGQGHDHPSLVSLVDRLGRGLRARGVRPGCRVLLLAKNRPEWVVAFLGIAAAGAVAVPVNPALTAHEVGRIAEHCSADLVICDEDLRESLPGVDPDRVVTLASDGGGTWCSLLAGPGPLAGPRACADTDPVAMFYTSGTTGAPKGVVLSHVAQYHTARITRDVFELSPRDRTLIPGSLSFIYPLVIDCLGHMLGGATVVLQDRFHPELALRAMEAEEITVFMGVPTMFTMMLDWAADRQVDLSKLRFCVSAGQNLPWEVARGFEERFGAPVYDLWGQTEGTPITSYFPSREPRGRPESCGRPLPGCGVRIVGDSGGECPAGEVGEVLLTGPQIMTGYYRNPGATSDTLRDGWISTGDLGKLDTDGYLYIVGRKKDMIIRGGANIYPIEIEEVLYAHPAVAECAVVGVADRKFGEVVKAFVAVKAGQSVDETALRAHCARRLAEYKVPVAIGFLDSLPKGPTGKILKRTLRERG